MDPTQNKVIRSAVYSKKHPIIPKLYVPGWKTDMANKRLTDQNVRMAGIPNFEHDETLYLENREQMFYNVEDRERVESKYRLPSREEMLHTPMYHPNSRHKCSLMHRK